MNLKSLIKNKIDDLLLKYGIKENLNYKIETPPKDEMGDFSSNVAFLSARFLKKNPKDIASEFALELSKDDFFKSVENANGFINMRISEKAYQNLLMKILSLPFSYGKTNLGKGKLIQFEFASVNPTGPLTVAHGRQAVMGDVLARIFSEVGYIVQKELYLNDAGKQIELLGKSLWVRYNQLLGEKMEIPEGGYQGEYLIDIAKEFLNEYGEKYKNRWDEKTKELFKKYVLERMVNSMKKTLDRLEIYFDVFFRESSLIQEKIVDKVLDYLKSKDLLYEKDGALWFKVSNFINESDKVLIRSDKTHTYFCTDIAYHYNKHERGFEKVYDIWGADHHGHIPRMKAAMNALDIEDGFFNVILHQLVTLKRGKEILRMSTRKGEFITLDELIDEVGKDAVRYFFAMVDPDTHTNFDMELAVKKSNENPVFYVQYAHARISSIFEKAKEKGIEFRIFENINQLKEPEELLLIRELSLFPSILEEAAQLKKTNILTAYTEKIAERFHRFYNKLPVLNASDSKIINARLNLCLATKIVLKRALDILGVTAPERM